MVEVEWPCLFERSILLNIWFSDRPLFIMKMSNVLKGFAAVITHTIAPYNCITSQVICKEHTIPYQEQFSGCMQLCWPHISICIQWFCSNWCKGSAVMSSETIFWTLKLPVWLSFSANFMSDDWFHRWCRHVNRRGTAMPRNRASFVCVSYWPVWKNSGVSNRSSPSNGTETVHPQLCTL